MTNVQRGGIFIIPTPTTTEYIIDKKTYIVETHESENATDTLKSKIEKLIIRDLRQIPKNEINIEENSLKDIDETDKT